jgi:hypothetical protein
MDEYYDEEDYWQAADEPETGSGCLLVFLLPPLLVVVLGMLFSFALDGLKTPVRASGELASINQSVDASHPGLAPLFTPEIDHWGDEIVAWATQMGLDPNLVATVMQIESCGDPRALSSAGAIGLFQVMPYHFETGENPYLPNTNAQRGLGYLKQSLASANGNYRLAFAGYNGGIGVIPKAETSWAAETIRYVYWGSGIYGDALQGASSSARLDEWLSSGGASLCEQAHARQ